MSDQPPMSWAVSHSFSFSPLSPTLLGPVPGKKAEAEPARTQIGPQPGLCPTRAFSLTVLPGMARARLGQRFHRQPHPHCSALVSERITPSSIPYQHSGVLTAANELPLERSPGRDPLGSRGHCGLWRVSLRVHLLGKTNLFPYERFLQEGLPSVPHEWGSAPTVVNVSMKDTHRQCCLSSTWGVWDDFPPLQTTLNVLT